MVEWSNALMMRCLRKKSERIMIGMAPMVINSGDFGACAKISGSVIRLLYSYNFATKKPSLTKILTSLNKSHQILLAVSSDADLHLHLVQAFIMQLSCSSSCTSSFYPQIILQFNPTRLRSAVEGRKRSAGNCFFLLPYFATATTDWRQ